MKNIFILLVFTFQLCSVEYGIAAIATNNTDSHVKVGLKLGVVKFDIDVGNENNFIAFDVLFLERTLIGKLNWFVGLGSTASANFETVLPRLPIGIDINILPQLDMYIEGNFILDVATFFASDGHSFDGGIRYFF